MCRLYSNNEWDYEVRIKQKDFLLYKSTQVLLEPPNIMTSAADVENAENIKYITFDRAFYSGKLINSFFLTVLDPVSSILYSALI